MWLLQFENCVKLEVYRKIQKEKIKISKVIILSILNWNAKKKKIQNKTNDKIETTFYLVNFMHFILIELDFSEKVIDMFTFYDLFFSSSFFLIFIAFTVDIMFIEFGLAGTMYHNNCDWWIAKNKRTLCFGVCWLISTPELFELIAIESG